MSVKKVFRAASPVAIAVFLSSCGGGATDGSSGSVIEPIAGAANGVTNPSEGSSNSGTSISGRVADGYIQGATVCVDLNNSDSCDDNEPSTVTGAGGSYDLTIPAGAEDKPIVADIPASAIDEDTGEAIGKPLVFIAPADQPEFVSPITTLVHQELQSNPSLNTEDAENAVKTLLGVSEEDVSLFADYVAGGKEEGGDADRQDNFRYLHDTARVVTSMMKDIESEVESAAQSNGIDVVGSEDTQRAIRDIVRREVRELLPDIARQVADIVRSEEAAGADLDTGEQGSSAFDPDKIALSLRPEDVTKDVQERIDAVVDRIEAVQADMQQLLADGVYFMEFDCDYEHYVSEPVPYGPAPDSTKFEDDADVGADGQIHGGEVPNCTPFYGNVQLNDAGDALISQNYGFDRESGTWVEDDFEGNELSDYVLVDGEWQQFASSGPAGTVEFAADGTAVISNAEGTMQLKAVTQILDATEVKKHLLSDNADPAWFELVKPTDMFPSGSEAHMVSVKQTLHPYVLFNVPPYDDSGEASCAQYYDNCNVISHSVDDQLYTLSSLTEVREAAIQGLPLTSTHSGIGSGAMMTFMTDGESDGTLPSAGMVKWSFGYDEAQYVPDGEYLVPDAGATYPVGQVDVDGCYGPDTYPGELIPEIPGLIDLPDADIEFPISEGSEFYPEAEYERPVAEQDPDDSLTFKEAFNEADFSELPDVQFPMPGIDGCADIAAQSGEIKESAELAGKPPIDEYSMMSRWKLIEVDGVEMIEVQLPDMFRYDGDKSEQAMLLVEHNGFVRLGARTADTFIDRVATYNETAFTSLRAIVESSVAPR